MVLWKWFTFKRKEAYIFPETHWIYSAINQFYQSILGPFPEGGPHLVECCQTEASVPSDILSDP